jgi:hypothetical protein
MYKLTNGQTIVRVLDSACIPADEKNADYQEYLAWLEKENVPAPADPLPPPVFSCTPWQIRKALNIAGLRLSVENMIAGTSDVDLKDGWEFASEFRSDDPFVISMGAALGKSAEETALMIKDATLL